MGRELSRRELLRRTAAAGAATAMSRPALAQIANSAAQESPEVLSATEFRALRAVVARLIPSDENGPGALEAGAARYIDRALGDALADSREAYAAGLRTLDEHAQATHGRAFATLEADAQDAILEDLERNTLQGFRPSAAAFFDLVLSHTTEGTFSDPYHGGNRDFIGWDMIGYPGIRLAVGPAEQRYEPPANVTRMSAYDIPMFEALDPEGDESNGR